MEVKDKRKVLKLLVKEILVGNESIEIKHLIPLKETENERQKKSYELCTWGGPPPYCTHVSGSYILSRIS